MNDAIRAAGATPASGASPEDNPLREGLAAGQEVKPFTLVLFGATGDLAWRKIGPALYNLAFEGLLPEQVDVVGVSRRETSDEAFEQRLHEGVDSFSRRRPADGSVWKRFRWRYVDGDFDAPRTYERLREALSGAGNVLYYLATPPSFYAAIAERLGEAGMGGERAGGWTRIVVEKPFGRDLESALALNRRLLSVFREEQVFRIDHYLGKETVQNILVFRFANGIWEPVWNRQFVEQVEITVSESIGVEGRGSYYEEAGALRDMVQNHLMQLLCLVAMEPPAGFDADAVRDEKVKVLHAARFEQVVRGQYTSGWVEGQEIPDYRAERGVAADSAVETYAALRLFVENWRWADVPFLLRTGKALPRRASEVAVRFRRAPHTPFRSTASPELDANVLVLRIQPDEGITLRFGAKVPGPEIRIRAVNMDFRYGAAFGDDDPDAYERLILDCLRGDSTLFTRRDEVEASWRLLDPFLSRPSELHTYAAGTWGPAVADGLCRWRKP